MDVSAKIGDENFIPLYQLRFLAGRNYMKSDSLREMVINATYAKALGFKKPADAVNQFIEFQGKPYPIVGVVADFHEQSFHEKIGAVFLGYMPRQAKNIGVKLTTKGRTVERPKKLRCRVSSSSGKKCIQTISSTIHFWMSPSPNSTKKSRKRPSLSTPRQPLPS